MTLVEGWITGCTAAVNKQCALSASCWESAFQCFCVIEHILTFNARITEQHDRICRLPFVIKNREDCVGRVAFETVAALGPSLQEQVVANVTHELLRTVRKEHRCRCDILQCQDTIFECDALCSLHKLDFRRLG